MLHGECNALTIIKIPLESQIIGSQLREAKRDVDDALAGVVVGVVVEDILLEAKVLTKGSALEET